MDERAKQRELELPVEPVADLDTVVAYEQAAEGDQIPAEGATPAPVAHSPQGSAVAADPAALPSFDLRGFQPDDAPAAETPDTGAGAVEPVEQPRPSL